MRLFEPVSIDEESQVTTLDGDERRQPRGETSAADEKIIQKFAEEINENWTRSRDRDDQCQLTETGKEEQQSDLIDHTQAQQIASDTVAPARASTNGEEREKIVRQSNEKSEEGEKNQHGHGSALPSGNKIGEEELIEGDRKRVRTGLTLPTGMTSRTETDGIGGTSLIATQTSTFV